ncbi:MAG: alpha/beta fold hydrolase [Minisyncoccales bacterium]
MNYPFLIIHGWGKGSQSWQTIKEILTNKGYQVVVPDLPGFGQNPPPIKPWSIDDYVAWIKNYIEQNKLSPVNLLGHSFGGAVAVKYSLKYPQDIKKLFLIAPALIRKQTIKIKFLKKSSNFLNKLFKSKSCPRFSIICKKIFYKVLRIKSDYLSVEGVMKDTFLNILKEDLSAELIKISLPTIIIWGEKDDVLPVKQAHLINQKIENSKLIIIPAANHNLSQTKPQILAEKILENINHN